MASHHNNPRPPNPVSTTAENQYDHHTIALPPIRPWIKDPQQSILVGVVVILNSSTNNNNKTGIPFQCPSQSNVILLCCTAAKLAWNMIHRRRIRRMDWWSESRDYLLPRTINKIINCWTTTFEPRSIVPVTSAPSTPYCPPVQGKYIRVTLTYYSPANWLTKKLCRV